MQEQIPTVEQIQGRLNQREIPFKVSKGDEGTLVFVPTTGVRGLRVAWDLALGYPLAQVVDWLEIYRPFDPS